MQGRESRGSSSRQPLGQGQGVDHPGGAIGKREKMGEVKVEVGMRGARTCLASSRRASTRAMEMHGGISMGLVDVRLLT